MYDVIYADPPWEYRHCASNCRRIENHYPTMKLEDIKNINIPTNKDAVLFLWTTSPKLEEGLAVLKCWGFDYRSSLIWDKNVLGLGYWFRIQHEILLVGVKGNFPPPNASKRISSILKIKRGQHSDKPDFIKFKIDEWYPNAKKLEMFYREKTPLFQSNWDVWGNETNNDIDLTFSSNKTEK